MKKLFTLSIAIFCVVAINAQVSGSGNGFADNFDYDDGTVYEDVAYEGIEAEWPDEAVIEDGMLKWDLAAGGEGAIGMWELQMDLTGNTDITFMYQFPADAEFGIWIEDHDGGGNEIFPLDFQLGLSELMEYTFDASALEDVDLSNVAEIWIMSATAAGGTFYLDDLVIGDGSLTGESSKVSGSGNGFADNFDYDDATVYEDVAYEGIEAEWPDEAVIEDGKLKWDLAAGGEGAIGLWELQMDLTGNTDITFMYQFPADAEFGIWIEDHDGGGNEIFPLDFQLGLSELMDYTFDASALEDVDLSNVAEIWIMSATAAGGTFYLDDLVIGDGSLTGISSKLVKSSLLVYPNPASEGFRIDADVKSLSIFNSIGQIVYSMENYQKGSSLDISDLEKGLYIIKADDNAHKLIVK